MTGLLKNNQALNAHLDLTAYGIEHGPWSIVHGLCHNLCAISRQPLIRMFS